MSDTNETVEQTEEPAQRTVGEMTPDELGSTLGKAIGDEVRGALGDLLDAKRETVVRPAAGSAGRTQPVALADHRYERLYQSSPELRGIRTAENDIHVKEWNSAMLGRDKAKLEQLRAERPEFYTDGAETQRAITTATNDSIVPMPLSAAIVAKRETLEVIGPRSQQYSSASGQISIPVEAVVVTPVAKVENVAATEDDVTMPDVVLVEKTSSGVVISSQELADDSAYQLSTVLSNQAGRGFGLYNDAWDADGLNVQSLIQSTKIVEATKSGAVLTEADLITMYYAIKGPYRADAAWFMGTDLLTAAAGLVDANGRQLVTPYSSPLMGAGAGQGDQSGVQAIMGKPVFESPGMGDFGADPAGAIIFGSTMAGYGVLSKPGMIVKVSDEPIANYSVTYAFFQRRDSGVLLGEAFSRMVGFTS